MILFRRVLRTDPLRPISNRFNANKKNPLSNALLLETQKPYNSVLPRRMNLFLRPSPCHRCSMLAWASRSAASGESWPLTAISRAPPKELKNRPI
jgi:hypothetical protein